MTVFTIQPGTPFWSAFTAFAANVVVMLGLSELDVTELDLDATWASALVASLFVAAVVYGQAKMAESKAAPGLPLPPPDV